MFPLVNFNGKLVSKESTMFSFDHSAILGGEIIQEKIRLFQGAFLFQEKHYFHLMSNMRMARMDIPMDWTPDFFYEQLDKLKDEIGVENAVFQFNVSDNYNTTDFWVSATVLPDAFHFTNSYQIDQYRETHVETGFHHRVHFVEPRLRILKQYALENELQELVLLNEAKALAKAIDGNFFVIKENKLLTPKLEDGAKDDVLRDMILEAAKRAPQFDEVVQETIFPFSLMKADELFVAKEGKGIYSVTNFRKAVYSSEVTQDLLEFVFEIA